MNKNLIAIILYTVTISFFTGCATNSEYVQRNSQEIRDTKSKIYLLENDIISINTRLDEMDQQLANIPHNGEDSEEIKKLHSDLIKLNNQVEFHSNRISFLLESAESDAEAILSLQERTGNKHVQRNKTYSSKVDSRVSASPELIYSDAKKNYDANKLQEALAGFNNFLRDFPRHKLAANSQYWIGEIYYDADDYEKAIREFNKVEENYPESLKSPDAKFKVALCEIKLEKSEEAQSTLNSIKRFYPEYERMYKVDQFLKSLE